VAAATWPTSDAMWTRAGAPRTLRYELKDAGDDLIVSIAAEECDGTSFCGLPSGALLVDDLKLE